MFQFLLMTGVMLSSILACSYGQDHVPEKRVILMLLTQLKNTPSLSCLKDRTDFHFPWSRGEITQIHMAQGPCFQKLMLQQVFRLFNTEASRAAWNNSLLDRLLSSLYDSLEQLEQMEVSLACPSVGTDALKYFQRIKIYLKAKKYSACAWEIVRSEIEARFFLM